MRLMHCFAAIVAACILLSALFFVDPGYAQIPEPDTPATIDASPPFSGSLDMRTASGAHWVGQSGSRFNLRALGTTIEFWVEIPAGYQGSTEILGKPGAYEVALVNRNGALRLCFIGTCADAASLSTPGWHHVAVSYAVTNGGDVEFDTRKYLVDGQQVLSISTNPPSLPASTLPIEVGQGTPVQIDELRISKILRYGADAFPPPSGPFVCDDDTLALWPFDEGPSAPVYRNACGTPEDLARTFEVNAPLIVAVTASD